MKRVIEKVPVPLAGVTLGLTALGNLLASLSPILRWGCGTAARSAVLPAAGKADPVPGKDQKRLFQPNNFQCFRHVFHDADAALYLYLRLFPPQRPFSSGTRLSPATVR